jgi:hypothetical protein
LSGLFRMLRQLDSNDLESQTLRTTELQDCVGKVIDGSKEIIGTLRPGEFLRLKDATAKALLLLNPEYLEIVRVSRAKIEPLVKELAPINAAYVASKSLIPNSPEWNAAIEAYFGRGKKLREAIFAEQNAGQAQYEKLLKRLTEMIWIDLQKAS